MGLRTYDLPETITSPHAALLDGDGYLHIADTSGDEVAVIPTDTADGAMAVAIRIYLLPTTITSPRGMVLDVDGNIHVADTSGDEVAVISPNTADGDRAVVIRTYDLPTGTAIPSGLTIDADGNIHVSDSGDDNIRVYDPNVADGQRAVAIRTYDLPVNLGNPEGLTTDGDGNIHIVDISDDNVAVIAPDTADGQRAVALRTYGMPTGITAPQGLAFVPAADDTVTPTDPLSFGSENIANQSWQVGTAVSETLPTATGGTGTITYSLSPTIPAGVAFAAGTRRVNGTPTGRFTSSTFTYTAEDSDGTTVELTFTVVVTAAAITFDSSISNQLWTVGTAESVTLPTASGGVGEFTYSLTPTVPAGTTFVAGTRRVSGTPTDASASITYTYRATDDEGVSATRTFTVIVEAAAVALSFGSSTIANQLWVVGTAVSETLPTAAGGTGAIVYSLSPTPPTGVAFTAGVRLLAGNPSAVFTSDTFTYTAEDEDGTMVELTFTIVVTAAAIPLALSWLVPTSPVGNIFSVTLNSNHPLGGVELDDFRLRIQDNSDPVVALTATNTNISAVSGTNNWRLDITLTETLDAEYTMRLRRETVQYDGVDYPAVFLVSDTFSIDSSIGALTFGSESIDNQSWVVGTDVDITLPDATGGVGTITYSLSPTLPSGTTFTSGTQALSGNPTGRFTSETFTYTAMDTAGNIVTLTFTIIVTAPAITFTSNIANQSWQVGTLVSVTLPTATGGVGNFTYSLTPALPSGVSRTALVVSGTPNAAVTVAAYTYTAEDSEGIAQEQSFTIVVIAAPITTITPTISIADASLLRGESTTATITLSSAPTGFTVGDLSVDFGSLSNFTMVNSTTYTVEITAPLTSSGTITLTLAANAFTGSTNPVATATFNWTPITPVISVSTTSISLGIPFTVTITFPISVTGFTIADISVMNVVLSNFSGSGTTYIVTATPPNSGSGNITIIVTGNSVDEGNESVTRNLSYSENPDIPVIGDIFGATKADNNGAVNLQQ